MMAPGSDIKPQSKKKVDHTIPKNKNLHVLSHKTYPKKYTAKLHIHPITPQSEHEYWNVSPCLSALPQLLQ